MWDKNATDCFYRLGYDGQEDLLFNLDNKNLFYYDLLLDYVHLMVEEQNPLVAYLQASRRSHTSQSMTQGGRLAVLQRAWNAFLRLHDMEFTNSFQCLICAQNTDVVICDGTMLGFRKEFLAVNHLDHQQEDMPLLSGTMHKDRVHILQPRTHQLLVKYQWHEDQESQKPQTKWFTSLKARRISGSSESTYTHLPRSLQGLSPKIAWKESSMWTTTTWMW